MANIHTFFVVVQNVVNTHLPLLYFIVFLSAIVEGLPIIGAIYPGTTLIILLLSLTTTKDLNLLLLLFISCTGAFIGDYLSYMLGISSIRKIEKKVKEEKKMWKYSKKFFERYGTSSIILGRFITITRSFIPYIAGISKMDKKTFIIANIISSIVWTSAYIVVGYSLRDKWKWILINPHKSLILLLLIIVISILIKTLFLKEVK